MKNQHFLLSWVYLRLLLCLWFFGCAAPNQWSGQGIPSPLMIATALDSVNLALNQAQCSTALHMISPLYQSPYSNSDIRLAMGATYGCFANLQFFTLLNQIIQSSQTFTGSGFWNFLIQQFPSSLTPNDDQRPAFLVTGIQALMSAAQSDIFLNPEYFLNLTSNNPLALRSVDRVSDANLLLIFFGLALTGSELSRLDRSAGIHLPWTTYDQTSGAGCGFASGLLHFLDGIEFLKTNTAGALSNALSALQKIEAMGLDTMCASGCTLCADPTVTCKTCPPALRNPTSCTGTKEIYSCAAAGISQSVDLLIQAGSGL